MFTAFCHLYGDAGRTQNLGAVFYIKNSAKVEKKAFCITYLYFF